MQGDYSSEDKEQEIGGGFSFFFFSGADRKVVMNVWGNLVSFLSVSAPMAE